MIKKVEVSKKQTQADQSSVSPKFSGSDLNNILDEIRDYWNGFDHYEGLASHPVGTKGFYEELEAYRYERFKYLPRVVDYAAYEGKRLLEIGCSVGIDLIQFARHGADVTGVDLAEKPLAMARQNFSLNGVAGEFLTMNGENLQFDADSFDVVYVCGVIHYTNDTEGMIREAYRVLKPGGEAIFMTLNRFSWLTLISRLSGIRLEHGRSPVCKSFSIGEFRRILSYFSRVEVSIDQFPARSRLQSGLKGRAYNTLFVGAFNLIPKPMVRPFGAHLIAKAIK